MSNRHQQIRLQKFGAAGFVLVVMDHYSFVLAAIGFGIRERFDIGDRGVFAERVFPVAVPLKSVNNVVIGEVL